MSGERMKPGTIWAAALMLAALLCVSQHTHAAAQPMIEPNAQAMPLLPFLDFLLDENMDMDIEDAAKATGWQPLRPAKLPLSEGILWLRFTIGPLAPDARPQTYLLDPGPGIPGKPTLFTPFDNELSGRLEWRAVQPGQRNIFLLPEAGPESQICYIKLNGLPGPWFAPMIRTPQNAATNWGSLAHTGAVLSLGIVMLLCLLRGISEKGEWRYWTALFVAAALAQALIGMPQLNEYWTAYNLLAVLCPGLALMLLPHVGRHLLEARAHSKAIDIQLFLLSLPGALLALLPLVPGWNWLFRWADLWPLATIIFVPTALGAWLAKLPGSGRYLLACLLPPLFTAFGLAGAEFGMQANLLASAPAWGIALAALLLVTAAAPQNATARRDKKAGKKAALPDMQMPAPDSAAPADEIINLDHPLADPNLRLVPPQHEEQLPPPVIEYEPAPATQTAPQPAVNDCEAREMAMRAPLDDLMRESAALASCALPPSARQYAANIGLAAEKLARIISRQEDIPNPAQESRPHKKEPFNLQRVLRNAHDSVASGTEYSGNALSWYMPPHLAELYNGDGEALEETLRLLLESSARATSHGVIKLSARRVPNSPEPGHILFTVSDNGDGYPPRDRSSLALAKAWELAGKFNGFLSVDSSQHGSEIAFSAHFDQLNESDAEKERGRMPRAVIACDDPGDRRHLARVIETLPAMIDEASNPGEAIQYQREHPTSLLITKGRLARPSSADMIGEFKRIANDAGFAACYALAITEDDSQWILLKASGFTHAMLEPVDPDVLRRTVAKLAQPPGSLEQAAVAAAPEQGDASTAGDGEDKAPTMLIEQDLSIASSFEGPEWLGEPEPAEESDTGQTQPESRNVDLRDDAAHTEQTPADAHKDKTADAQPDVERPHFNAPESAIEWVGEPTPVRAPRKTSTENITSQPDGSADGGQQAGDVSKPIPEGASGSLEDFIIGVSEEDSKASVNAFMHNSADMVTNTLSQMLNGQSQKQEPLHPDPAIAALLERLDREMTRASAAFAEKNADEVAQAAALITKDAEEFGLRVIARLSSCVERAARAPDLAALQDILPDLQSGIERNKITLTHKNSH